MSCKITNKILKILILLTLISVNTGCIFKSEKLFEWRSLSALDPNTGVTGGGNNETEKNLHIYFVGFQNGTQHLFEWDLKANLAPNKIFSFDSGEVAISSYRGKNKEVIYTYRPLQSSPSSNQALGNLWIFDRNTKQAKKIPNVTGYSQGTYFNESENMFYASLFSGRYQTEFYKFDLEGSVLNLIKDLAPNSPQDNSSPSELVSSHGKLWLAAFSQGAGFENYILKDFQTPPEPFFDLRLGIIGSRPLSSVLAWDDAIYFIAQAQLNNKKSIYKIDPAQETAEPFNLSKSLISLHSLIFWNSSLYFACTYQENSTTFKSKLCKTDEVGNIQNLLSGNNDFSVVTQVSNLKVSDKQLFFQGIDQNQKTNIYYADLGGEIHKIQLPTDVQNPTPIYANKNFLVFTGYKFGLGEEIYFFNPISNQIKIISDLNPENFSSYVRVVFE